jgi:hypothetical protein
MGGGLRFVVSEFTDNGRATTGNVRRWTRTPGECGEPVFTDVHGVHPKHLLVTTDCWGVSTHTETGTDQLLLHGRQVIHATLIIHAITHV